MAQNGRRVFNFSTFSHFNFSIFTRRFTKPSSMSRFAKRKDSKVWGLCRSPSCTKCPIISSGRISGPRPPPPTPASTTPPCGVFLKEALSKKKRVDFEQKRVDFRRRRAGFRTPPARTPRARASASPLRATPTRASAVHSSSSNRVLSNRISKNLQESNLEEESNLSSRSVDKRERVRVLSKVGGRGRRASLSLCDLGQRDLLFWTSG